MNETPPPPTPSVPAGTPMSPSQSASGRSLTALILGIATFVCCGFLAGIPAFFLGRAEEKAIDRGQAPEAGRTFAKIGWILGLVGTLLNCISLIVMILYFWKVGIPQMPQKGF